MGDLQRTLNVSYNLQIICPYHQSVISVGSKTFHGSYDPTYQSFKGPRRFLRGNFKRVLFHYTKPQHVVNDGF